MAEYGLPSYGSGLSPPAKPIAELGRRDERWAAKTVTERGTVEKKPKIAEKIAGKMLKCRGYK